MAFQILPPKRPQQSREKTIEQLLAGGWDATRYPVALLGVRGYYRDTMGVKGRNDRKLYDDAIFIVWPNGGFAAFNANVDPGAFRAGIATLLPGVWKYRVGIHGISKPANRRYTALVQAAAVTVQRDGRTITFSGLFGMNIHKGGRFTVSSEGCQTIWPTQWDEFIDTAQDVLREHGQETIPYVLTEIPAVA